MLNSNYLIFNSIHELVEDLDNSKDLDRDDSSDDRRSSDWCDTDSYEEAKMYLTQGRLYDDLGADIEKYRTKGTATKRSAEMSVQGHTVVVPLYLQGIPNNMITNKKKINNKIITIIYSPQAPHYVSNDELIKGATKLFKNIVSLESEGYRVNLYVVECNNDKFGYALKLKTDRETLNIKKMCFPLVSSSFLRRIGFRIKERLYKDWIGCGYGSGIFDYNEYDRFIKKYLKVRNYEIWNYQGKKSK